MNVVLLRILPELAIIPTMDHAAVHGNRLIEDLVDHGFAIRGPHGHNASLGECEVDGLCEVQRNGVRVAKI